MPGVGRLKARESAPPVVASGGGLRLHPAALGLLSGCALWCAFPPASWSWLAFIALVPLFVLIRDTRHPAWIYLGAWIAGEVFWLAAIRWVWLADETAWLGWVVMAGALSIGWPIFLWIARTVDRRLKIPLCISAPLIWVGLEYARAYFLTGFPWYYLAHSQAYNPIRPDWPNPLIQISDLTGAWGVSFLVAFVNAAIAEWVIASNEPAPDRKSAARRSAVRATVAAGVLVALALAYGGIRSAQARYKDGPRVALLQTDVIQRYRDSVTSEELIEKFRSLLMRGRPAVTDNGPPAPDLVIWPETMYPFGHMTVDPKMSEAELDRQAKLINSTWSAQFVRERGKDNADYIHAWTDSVGAPMLVGMIHYVFGAGGPGRYNAAVLFTPGSREIQAYHKIHLVPFGEYVPLVKTFPWLVALTPYRGTRVPGLSFGDDVSSFKLGPWRFAAWICFEDTVPQLARRFFAGMPRSEMPQFIVNTSNDGWFHGSEEHDMHLASAIFRAVEFRRPVARSVNLGITAIIDGDGVVRQRLAKKVLGKLEGVLPLDNRESFYAQTGDWLGQAGLALAVGCLLIAPFRRRRAAAAA